MMITFCNSRKKLWVPVLLLYIIACRKDSPAPAVTDRNNALLADSIFLYAKQVYLWNDQLPEQFNTAPYLAADGSLNYKAELSAISSIAINPATGRPYEFNRLRPSLPKYSAVFGQADKVETDAGSRMLNISGRFGISLVAMGEQELRIKYIVKGSDAALAGMRRGMRILAVNGRPVEISPAYYRYVEKIFNEENRLTLSCSDGATSRDFSLLYSRTNYFEPVLGDALFEPLPGHKTGYLAYLKFIDVTHAYRDLDEILTGFSRQGIADIIIDLRYNGGGNLAELDKFANLLVPQPAHGKVMRKERYNALMQSGRASLLQLQPVLDNNGLPFYQNGKLVTYADIDYTETGNTVYFNKVSGPGTLKKAIFIVSEETASAAELLISCLSPYLETHIIGVYAGNAGTVRTYGKPVGFFPLKTGSLTVYYALFSNVNAQGAGDYYEGMTATVSVYDDPRYNFGERGEPGLEAALAQIAGKGARRALPELLQPPVQWQDVNIHPEKTGMIKSVFRLKSGAQVTTE
ncbi:hypothetical protein ECE50_020510 [Chitinophaga sp. Mgbs1]|uniref:PDZ domain-containing protein n=1 Tax=Chitinophaga solisilvae TaxID=1233460 RepID=A0A9Q5D3Y2_9BACT|nr:hypothetical protein [Chitinophaga solisilvae]